MNDDFMTPKKNKSPKRKTTAAVSDPPEYSPEAMKRPRKGRTLLVELASDERQRRCVILRDDWTNADVRVGDVINVIGTFKSSRSPSSSVVVPSITIDSKANLFIHHPDLLITATSLSSAPQCRRKPLVSNLVRCSMDATPSLVWGNMLHEVMQSCLSAGRWDERWVDEQISEQIAKGLGELMRVNMTVEQAHIEVRARAKGLKRFAEKYIAQEPKPDAVLTNTRAHQGQTSLLAIPHLHDVEEDIWSPTYGLKGKVDASVQAVIADVDDSSSPFAKAAPRRTSHSWTMPFEIKTGRAVAGMEHRAQTMLYTLLMAERYGTEVPSGLLYYTQSDTVVRVPAARNEVRALLATRNEMAGYMMRRMRVTGAPKHAVAKLEESGEDVRSLPEAEPFLPETIDDSWACGNCFALDTCMLYRKAVEEIVDTGSPIADIYALKTGHLTASQGAFFKKWEALISLEEQDLVRFKKELWTMGAEEREAHGRCFSDMELDTTYTPLASSLKPTSQKESKIHRFTYRFVKGSWMHVSLLNGHMSCGDAITISVEPDLLAFARGFIVELNPQEVVVGIDHELNLETIGTRLRKSGRRTDNIVFRVDKDELFGGMGRMRDNLAQLFYVDRDTRRLGQVVDLKAPTFIEDDGVSDPMCPEVLQLNANQKAAVQKVLTAEDYALILGMPGTGKTTVIAAIIRQLVNMGKTVLLASYTHSAVDTILLKLKDDADFGILRVGNIDKIHPDAHEFTLSARRPATTIEQLERQVMAPPVVATTCLTVDQYVRNINARKGGLDVSLFRRLSDANPQAVVDLVEQYRMNADIMLLSNKLIYSDRLRCGSEEVANRSLVLPEGSFLRGLHVSAKMRCQQEDCWLAKLLDERCKAVFVDTDAVPARDSPVGDLVENRIEARLVCQVTESLLRSGVRQDQIGVLSLYRQQIKLLSYMLQDKKDIEILTADRSQGRDKDCIIISMVRSNADGQVGNLIKDWRRMNVSFTRARSKLIIFGSRSTLQTTPLLREFFDLMDGQGWILRLPADAHELHEFPEQCRKKRPAEDADPGADLSSSDPRENTRLSKKGRKSGMEEGLLRGRPILRDLVNDGKS
ncbi:Dna2-domain-containing protein [Amylocystis lapponica]|nr:Dna2-domain-containing protein [Amylocystis lapponica]